MQVDLGEGSWRFCVEELNTGESGQAKVWFWAENCNKYMKIS
jgi:hypothetical protein